jgi:hypothetical protein
VRDIKIGIVFVALLFWLHGCGNATDPVTATKDTGVQAPEQKKTETKESQTESTQKREEQVTVSGLRVLKEDVKSKIPEYLVKIPLYKTDQHKETE